MLYPKRLTSSARRAKELVRRPSLARWLFLSFILMIGSSQVLMFGMVFYREYNKSRESRLQFLKQRVDFILAKNESGRLAGDYAELTRTLYELAGTDAVAVLDKSCGTLSSAPLNAKIPKNCTSSSADWIYVAFDDPYSQVGGVGIRQEGSLWKGVWRTFLSSYLLFLFYAVFLSLILLIWLRRYFARQVGAVVESIRRLGRGTRGSYMAPDKYPSELLPLYEAMTLAVRDLEEAQRKIREQSHVEAVAEVAAEVGHDIRSPLAVLNSFRAKLGAVPEQERSLVVSAINQITEIADDLLSENREARRAARAESSTLKVSEMATLLESLVLEKRAEYGGRPGLKISCSLGEISSDVEVRADPLELKRVLSNLVNNSAEAVGEHGVVEVSLDVSAEKATIAISDNGRGLTEDELDRVWNHGESLGKVDGNAIGLARARKIIARWGAQMHMRSSLGQGTVVAIELPLAKKALPSSDLKNVRIVLIDDELIIRKSWELAAAERDILMIAVSTPDEFWQISAQLDRATEVYVDARLGAGMDGVDVARKIHESGFVRVYLCTGDPASKHRGAVFLSGVVGKEFPR